MENLPIDPSLLELNQVLKEADDLYRSATRRLGVPECTLWVLYSLRVWPGPITQTQLCQLIHQPKQTINSALKAMEAKGHITLSPGSDRRTREITLTPQGVELAEQTADWLIRAEGQALASLQPAQRQAFLQAYRKFNLLLRDAIDSWGMSKPQR
ncbi:MAG: MarR family transcriptional regulator [Acutalibacter sp.]|nr:MarR family transcriptional regulator [Acutalibacter sp.]